MNAIHPLLRTAILAALAVTPAWAWAGNAPVAMAGLDTTEAPRVTQTVNLRDVVVLAQSHLALVSTLTPTATVPDATTMNHLQLVLKHSDLRETQLQRLIAEQHDPSSTRFHQWLTPRQYGEALGVADGDIAAASAWLSAQGFKVNGVYPNKLQIDFSGTAGQVKTAFHTQENHYLIRGEDHIANAGDISVPAALQPIVTGVAGLNDLQPQPQHAATTMLGTRNPATGRFATADTAAAAATTATPMAISYTGGSRGLVPYDLAQMYGVMPLRKQGVVGKGITIALVELGSALPDDWSNFVTQFNLGGFGGTFRQFNPQVGSMTNCYDVNANFPTRLENFSAAEDAEWATAIAPGANIEVAACSSLAPDGSPSSDNHYGGIFVAASNLINGDERPDIMSVTYAYGESNTDSASKAAIDQMWAQADVEGISVFVATGNTGGEPDFNSQIINSVGLSASSLATSPNVTAVGGTDTADLLDGTTAQYFSDKPNADYGTALGYVPEIPWNASCGNSVAAKANGFADAIAFCKLRLKLDPGAHYVTSVGSSSGASTVDRKPAWQRLVHNAAKDQSRDVPDVALFAASYNNDSSLIICLESAPCTPGFTGPVVLDVGTSLAAPMFAGIQALVDQGLAMRGLPADQGNAAPTLYALAQQEYGGATGAAPASLATCNADNGSGTAGCVFHNITRSSTSSQCFQEEGQFTTPDCYFYATMKVQGFTYDFGLSSLDPSQPYSAQTKAYRAQPGWSFASGLGSVNAKNLLSAWARFVNAPPAP